MALFVLIGASGLILLSGSRSAFLAGLMSAAAAVKFFLVAVVLLYLPLAAGRRLFASGKRG